MAYRVLVIDDEPWSRSIVISLTEWERLDLELAGEAEDALDALSKIKNLKPEIIITDMRMPGMSGRDFLKELEEGFPDLKIIVLSGYDDFEYLQQAVRTGAADYLLKPVDRTQMNDTLEKCIKDLHLKSKFSGYSSSIIFSDSAVLETYIGYRKKVFANLLELNREAVILSLIDLQNTLNEKAPDISPRTVSRILHDFTLMIEEFATRFGLDSQSITGLTQIAQSNTVKEVFDSIIRLYEDAVDLIIEFQNRKGSLNLGEVRDHIDRYYQEQLTLESVSKLFLVTKEHLSRAFKKNFGITINEYITSLRMRKARELIVDEGLEIKQAAFLCGYSELPYFYRVFKKYYGVAPGEMRS